MVVGVLVIARAVNILSDLIITDRPPRADAKWSSLPNIASKVDTYTHRDDASAISAVHVEERERGGFLSLVRACCVLRTLPASGSRSPCPAEGTAIRRFF